MHLIAAAGTYLANKPAGTNLAFLIVALIMFALATAVALFFRAFWAAVLCLGLVFFVLAFIVSGS
jgi:hypothetical protein